MPSRIKYKTLCKCFLLKTGADVIRGRGEGNVKRETEKEEIAKENGKGKIREIKGKSLK